MSTEIQIGLERTVFSMNEGETVEVCTILVGSDQIYPVGLIVAFLSLSAVPDTADGEGISTLMCNTINLHYLLYVYRE